MRYTKDQQVIQGAEAWIYRGSCLDQPAMIKERIQKRYRIEQLDTRIRKSRTATEAKVLAQAYLGGVNVPELYFVDTSNFVIVMREIEGRPLKDLSSDSKFLSYLKQYGRLVGILHNLDIIHGDLTTSNAMLEDSEVFLIDFGLARFSSSLEDKAVDLIVLKRTLESTHSAIYEKGWIAFQEGYFTESGIDSDTMTKKIEQVERRKRYIGH